MNNPSPFGSSAAAQIPYLLDRGPILLELRRATGRPRRWDPLRIGRQRSNRSWPAGSTLLKPCFVASGQDLRIFFNDAYLPLLGTRGTNAGGEPFAEGWPDIWADTEPIVLKALAPATHGKTCMRSTRPSGHRLRCGERRV